MAMSRNKHAYLACIISILSVGLGYQPTYANESDENKQKIIQILL